MSSFSIGQMNQLGDALERHGFTPEHVTMLGQNKDGILPLIKGTLNGACEIKMRVFPVWETIQIGIYGSANRYLQYLVRSTYHVTKKAVDIMKKPGRWGFKTAKIVEDVHLVKVTPHDLGFHHEPRFDEFCCRGQEFGFELCPAEVGPALRLSYRNQPLGERINIAMETITDSCGAPNVFIVRHVDGAPQLAVAYYCPSMPVNLGDEWVFRSRE